MRLRLVRPAREGLLRLLLQGLQLGPAFHRLVEGRLGGIEVVQDRLDVGEGLGVEVRLVGLLLQRGHGLLHHLDAFRKPVQLQLQLVAQLVGARPGLAPVPDRLLGALAVGVVGDVEGLAASGPVAVAAGVGLDATGLLEHQGAGDAVVEEAAVMAHHQQRAPVGHELLFQHFEGLDVEVVGGLVQDQQVRRLGEQPGQDDAVALAAGQRRHRGHGPLGAEEEALEVADDVARPAVDEDVVAAVGDGLGHGLVGVELPPQLVEVADLEIGARLHRPGVGRDLPHQDAQQRALADAVVADEPDAVTAHDAERQVPDQRLAAVAVGDVAELHHLAAGLSAVLHVDARVSLGLEPLGRLLAHGHERAHPAFVARAARLDAAPDPFLLLGQPLVEQGVVPGVFRQGLLLELEVVVVAAGPAREPGAIQLHDAGGQAPQEGAVVGDEQDAAGVIVDPVLEPLDRAQVEMVGGLVEEQQLGVADDGPGQPHPALPAAGQLFQPPVRRQVQLAQDRIHALVHVPAAVGVDLPMQRLQLQQAPAVQGLPGALLIEVDEVLQVRQPGGDVFPHRLPELFGQRLLQLAHADAALVADLAVVGLEPTRDKAQQRGLARAVAADQADPLSRLDSEVRVRQQPLISQLQRDVFETYEGHGRVRGTGARSSRYRRFAPTSGRGWPGRPAAGRPLSS